MSKGKPVVAVTVATGPTYRAVNAATHNMAVGAISIRTIRGQMMFINKIIGTAEMAVMARTKL